jgi:hypothetical protein
MTSSVLLYLIMFYLLPALVKSCEKCIYFQRIHGEMSNKRIFEASLSPFMFCTKIANVLDSTGL